MRFLNPCYLRQVGRFVFSFCLIFIVSVHAQTGSVAVAANMKDAFADIDAAFKATGKPGLKVIYGSSGNFTAQILNGAPFNLFISADEQFPLELYKQGKTQNEGKVYAIGKLVMFTKNSSGITLLNNRAELARAIAKANKVAIAKPELAPYGRAAVEYLKAEELWDLAKDKLIYGDNIAVTTMYVATGAADIGFSALSLVKSPELSKDVRYVLVDEKKYEPIKQRMVVLKGAPPDAEQMYAFIQSPTAKAILIRYGYSVPGN